jgi:hypothetical protein
MSTVELLTAEDQAWLAAEGRRIATRVDFLIAQLRGASDTDLREAAKPVLLHYNGTLVPAHVLLAQTLRGIHYSQIFEEWDYKAACAIHGLARSLSPADGEILLAASEYADCSLDEMADTAGEAKREAWEAMYGEPSDEEFDRE